ncbi:MAG: hypothetical protein LBS98_05680, partial [Coriobacteriales bacterium]|nr:hypothetical protein [Coriobacteriales bacterium]
MVRRSLFVALSVMLALSFVPLAWAEEGQSLVYGSDEAGLSTSGTELTETDDEAVLGDDVPSDTALEADPPTDDSALAPLALPAPLTTSSTYLIRPLASKNAVLDVLAGSKTKGANITV